jgi:hypothetical protein
MAAGKVPVKAVLIDLSGTLHVEDTAIPGAVDALKRYCVLTVVWKLVKVMLFVGN